jgi:hypothetical protein
VVLLSVFAAQTDNPSRLRARQRPAPTHCEAPSATCLRCARSQGLPAHLPVPAACPCRAAGNRPIQVKRSNWDERNVMDKRTGKAKKRQIMVKDKPPPKRQAGGGGILHR